MNNSGGKICKGTGKKILAGEWNCWDWNPR